MYNHERLRRRSPHNSKTAAEAFEIHLRQQVAHLGSVRNALLAAQPRPMVHVATFAEFATRWLREYVDVNNKPSERRNKRSALSVHLLPMLGELTLRQITSRSCEQLKAELLERGLSAKTVNNYLTILRKCLDTAVEWGELDIVPKIRQLKTMPPSFRFLGREEVEAVLVHAFDDDWRALILTAVRTGMRFGELSALRWGDIDLDRRLVHVRRSRYLGLEGAPKNHRSRYIPLAIDVANVLRARRGDAATTVFQHAGDAIPWHIASRTLKRICEAARVKPCGWHTFRHTFASELALRSVPLQVIRELLGHANIQMTLRYAHLTQDALYEAVARLALPETGEGLAAGCQPLFGTLPDLHTTATASGVISAQQKQKTSLVAMPDAWSR